MRANKLRIEIWLTILQQHGNDFAEIGVQLVKRRPLRVGARKPWDEPDKKTGVRVALEPGA